MRVTLKPNFDRRHDTKAGPKRTSWNDDSIVRRCREAGMNNQIISLGVVVAGFLSSARGGADTPNPSLDHIERFSTNQVTIHFNVEANKNYTLQAIDLVSLSSNSSVNSGTTRSSWTNVFVAPKLPFFEHYVIVDWRTNAARIYRLKVTD